MIGIAYTINIFSRFWILIINTMTEILINITVLSIITIVGCPYFRGSSFGSAAEGFGSFGTAGVSFGMRVCQFRGAMHAVPVRFLQAWTSK